MKQNEQARKPKKRTRKSKPIVEAIESETKTIEDSNDGQRAADVLSKPSKQQKKLF